MRMPREAPKRAAIPAKWAAFVRKYGANRAYWYAPKGLAVTPESIKERLAILREFEGSASWRDVQADYIAALKTAHVSEAGSEWPDGGAPLARMLKQVFNVLGLAWVDDADHVEITKAGEKLLNADDPANVLSDQMSRYQFWNPAVRSREHQVVRIHPVPFLGELLRSIESSRISATEYTLFVATARTQNAIDDVAEQIAEFRKLSPPEQEAICERCDDYMLGGPRRSSIYNTIRLNRSYAFGMWTLSNLIDWDESGLKLAAGQLRHFRAYLTRFAAEGAYIDYENQKDWIAYIGDSDAAPSKETALAYYVNKGNIKGAISVRKEQKASRKEIKDFEDMLISEKHMEDYLENNLDVLGKQIGAQLELIGRQYSTTVGPIDLLARDKKTGRYIVIELKKGHSADKVYGQTSRYMGWVRKNLANGAEVDGLIVAKSIDNKLKAACDAHDTKVHLIEFEIKMGARKV